MALTFGDATLRPDDTALLTPGKWLNDQVRRDERESEARHALSPPFFAQPSQPSPSQLIDFNSEAVRRLHRGPPPATFVILDAAAAHLARSGAAAAIAGPLNLATAPALIIPLNNADPAGPPPADGGAVGSHWSVLAFDRASWSFRHYDSATGEGNAAAAAGLVEALGRWLGGEGRSPPPLTTSPSTPRQANGSDCGLHACLAVRILAGVFSGDGGGEDVWSAADGAVAAAATPGAAAAARAGLRRGIEAAVAAGEDAQGDWVPPGF